jgi:hypothetical protein
MGFNNLNRKQIRDAAISNNHVAADAAIAETKLDIGWAAHYQAALESKKLLDYVQSNNIAVTNGGSVDIDLGTAPAADANSKGIDVSNNQPVLIRDTATGQPVELNGHEIYGQIALSSGTTYTVSFYANGSAVDLVGEFPETSAIDIQFPQRFDLYDVAESFAMNEKFVDGAVDVTEIQNLRQLAQDIYGGSWSLDNDGDANGITADETTLSIQAHLEALYDEIDAETSAREGADSTLTNNLAQEVTDRTDADTAIRNDLASTAANEGAALVGVEDVGNITGTVQDSLESIDTRLSSLESGGGAEVSNTHTREDNYDNGLFQTADYTELEDRLIDIETVLDTEVTNRTSADSAIQAELDAAELALGLEADGTKTNFTNSNYITADGTFKAGIDALDAALKAEETARISQDDVIEASVGLNADGSKPDYTSINYILADDTLVAAMNKMDAALKAEETARSDADTLIRSDLASTANAKGASLIGVEDASGKLTATTVEAALEELYDKTQTLEDDLAADSDALKGANMVGIQALANRTAGALTVQGGLVKLDADLKTVEDWKTSVANKIHVHSGEAFTPAELDTTVTTTTEVTVGTDFFAVYVNGTRQIPTTHYSVAQDGSVATFTFTDSFILGDNVYVEIVKYD